MASDGCQPLAVNGRMVGYNKDNQNGRIAFPASATSYSQLRQPVGGQRRSSTLQAGTVSGLDVEFRTRALYGNNNKAHEKTTFNEAGIPIGKSNATGTRYQSAGTAARSGGRPAAPQQAQAPPPAAPLSTHFAVKGLAKPLPSLGWRCNAGCPVEDATEAAVAAVQAGVSLLDAHGDAAVESALGAALGSTAADAAKQQGEVKGSASVVVSIVGGGDSAAKAQERLQGHLSVAVVPMDTWAASAVSAAASLQGVPLGLGCDSPAAAVEALTTILGGPPPYPAVLQVPLAPTSPKVQRMLVGLCKRRGVRILATDPLGGGAQHQELAVAALAAQKAAAAAASGAASSTAEKATADDESLPAHSLLLAWSIGRGVVALPSAEEGVSPADVAAMAAAAQPISYAVRAALDALAAQDGLRATAVTE
jgi:hypothetical protein